MENNPGRKIAVKHYTKPRTENGKLEWVENFISLVKKTSRNVPLIFMNIIGHTGWKGDTFQELVDWLVKTSDGARTFYNENKEIVKNTN